MCSPPNTVSIACIAPFAQLPRIGLYKRFVHFEAVVHESTILSFPPPTCVAHPVAIRLHDYWTVYDPASDLLFVCYTRHNIGNNNIV